jgi:hypothetical protein
MRTFEEELHKKYAGGRFPEYRFAIVLIFEIERKGG